MFQLTSYLVLIALVILVLKVRNSPGVALGLAWSTFAMEQVLQQAFPILMRHGMFVNFAIAALVAYAVACSRLRSNERLVPPPRPSLALYALLLLCVLSLGWSAAPVSSAAQLHKFAPYLILFVGITPFCATESSSITTAIKVTVYFGGLIALNLAFCDFGTRSVVLELADGRKAEGNPLALADYTSTVAICGMFMMFGKPARWATKILLATIVMLSVYMLLRSQSRGQVVAVFLAILIWLPITCRHMRRKSFIVPAIGILILTISAIYMIQQSDLAPRWRTAGLSSDGVTRIKMASTMLRHYQHGGAGAWMVGLGNSSSYGLTGGYPHNVPIEVLTEEGVLGFLLFFAFAWGTMSLSMNVLRHDRMPENARFNVGLLMALFTFHGSLSFKQGSLIGSSFLLSFGVCLCLACQRYQAGYLSKRSRTREFGIQARLGRRAVATDQVHPA